MGLLSDHVPTSDSFGASGTDELLGTVLETPVGTREIEPQSGCLTSPCKEGNGEVVESALFDIPPESFSADGVSEDGGSVLPVLHTFQEGTGSFDHITRRIADVAGKCRVW